MMIVLLFSCRHLDDVSYMSVEGEVLDPLNVVDTS